jgi:signal transduction histidine kinase
MLEILQNVIALYSEKENLTVTLRTRGNNQCVAHVDKDQFIRVLNNFFTNSIQAIPSDKEGRIDVYLRCTEKNILIQVSDNGIGISKENQHKIFVPNFTTKTTGTGLGLAMVKTIVEQNNGRVFFRSKEGKGTSFYVVLPQPNQ